MTISDEELVRMAREYLDGIKIGNVGGNELANAILSRFEKKPRKVGFWILEGDTPSVYYRKFTNKLDAEICAKEFEQVGKWSPIYVTGEEGKGPEHHIPSTEEKGREF